MDKNANIKLPEFLTLHQTPQAGRSLRASRKIQQGTILLEISRPAISVIYRRYRRETCAFCFAYDRGRHWKLRDTDAGISFCCDNCQRSWVQDLGSVGVEAFRCIGKWISKKGGGSKDKVDEEGDLEMADAEPQPNLEQIDTAFTSIAHRADLVREARILEAPPKRASRMLNAVLAEPGAPPDVLHALLSGILCLSKQQPPERQTTMEPDNRTFASSKPEDDLSIPYANATPYFTSSELQDHINAYVQLLAIIPSSLLKWVSESSCRFIAGVLFHNVFGTRSYDGVGDSRDGENGETSDGKLEEPGAELMGDMLLTTASLFNHSCSPNVRKVRKGRSWRFWAGRDIKPGEECCITYIGGEEELLGRDERRERLKVGWGFECACATCVDQTKGE